MAVEFVQRGMLGDGWRLEAREASVVIGVITESEGQYSFYQGLTSSWARTPCYETRTSKS